MSNKDREFRAALSHFNSPDIGRAPADEIVDMVFDTMSKSLVSGDRIESRGFGSFTAMHNNGYTGRNAKVAGRKYWRQSGFRFSGLARTRRTG